jgi:hypothetical protein
MRDCKSAYWRLMDRDPAITYDAIRDIRPSYMNVLSDRNYYLFGVLAGVRWRGVTPLFDHRGVPDDVSKATMKDIPFDSDYHSHTYFTVQELLDTDWDKAAAHQEMALFADQFAEWKDTGRPPAGLEKAQYLSTRGMWHKGNETFHRKVTEEEMMLLLLTDKTERLVKKLKPRIGGEKYRVGPYVVVELPRTYRDLVPEFVSVIPDLQALGPPDRVRVIIAYDN